MYSVFDVSEQTLTLCAGGNMEVLIQSLPSLTAVARLYIEDQKISGQTTTPYPHLNFLYEGPSVSHFSFNAKLLCPSLHPFLLFLLINACNVVYLDVCSPPQPRNNAHFLMDNLRSNGHQ